MTCFGITSGSATACSASSTVSQYLRRQCSCTSGQYFKALDATVSTVVDVATFSALSNGGNSVCVTPPSSCSAVSNTAISAALRQCVTTSSGAVTYYLLACYGTSSGGVATSFAKTTTTGLLTCVSAADASTCSGSWQAVLPVISATTGQTSDYYLQYCTASSVYWVFTGGPASATPCGPGYYLYSSSTSGYAVGTPTIQSDSLVCISCPSFAYSSSLGQVCSPCPIGTASTTGASYCLQCASGYYGATSQGSNHNTGCSICPSGTYSSTQASTSCISCTGSTYSLFGSSSACTATCPAFFITPTTFTNSAGCIACPTGLYSGTGSAYCSIVAPGYFGTSPSFNKWHAFAAGVMMYLSTSILDPRVTASSTICADGSFQPSPGQASCLSCPTNAWSSASTTTKFCLECPAGYYGNVNPSATSNNPCTPFPANTFLSSASGTTNTTGCVSCATGLYSVPGSSS